MLDYIRYSLRTLGRKKFRTLLTLVSIAIGVASVVLISSIGDIGKQTINQELSSLGLDSIMISKARKNTISPLGEKDLAVLREEEGVTTAAGLNFEYTELNMRSLVANAVIFGIDASAKEFISLEPLYGRMINSHDVAAGARVCVVDQNVAKAFYKRDNIVGKDVSILLGGVQQNFRVVGIVRSGGNLLQGLMTQYIPSFVYTPYSTLQQLSMKTDFDQIAIRLHAGQDSERAGAQLVRALEFRNGVSNGYSADDIARQKDTLNRLLDIVTIVLSLIAGVSLVVAGLGIMTVMMVSVNERTHEIGIKKSIGASHPIILFEFLVEAFAITLLGSLIGAVAGIALVSVGCAILGIQGAVHLQTLLVCILFSVMVGVIFGVYPASLAAKLKPVDALRSLG